MMDRQMPESSPRSTILYQDDPVIAPNFHIIATGSSLQSGKDLNGNVCLITIKLAMYSYTKRKSYYMTFLFI